MEENQFLKGVRVSADFMNNSGTGLFTSRDCCSGQAVAHAAVVNYRKWVTTLPMR
jgi:hypothetical protein